VAVEKFVFSYVASSHTCSLLAEAFKRYEVLLMDLYSNRKLQFV